MTLIYIAAVQTNEAVYVECLLKNMAVLSNSQDLAIHESYKKKEKKRTVAIETI